MSAALLVFLCLVVCAGLLFLMLFKQLRSTGELTKLKQWRSQAAGTADLLNYATVVDDGIVACKNGALLAGWVYKGSDLAQASDAEREYVSDTLNRALLGLGDGWMIHVDTVRQAVPLYFAPEVSHFPDLVSQAVDEERRRFFNQIGRMHDTFLVITVTWLPPRLVEKKFVDLMYDDHDTHAGRHDFEDLLDAFKKQLDTLESLLSSVFSMQRLNAQDYLNEEGQSERYDTLLQHLQRCITGIAQPVRLPNTPTYLDCLLGGQEFWGGLVPKMGTKFIQTVAIEGFPAMSSPGMLSALTDLDLEYRWSNRFIFLDQQTALAHITTYLRKWRQKIRGIIDVVLNRVGRVNKDAEEMTDDASEALKKVQSGEVAAGYYSSVVVLMDEDRHKVEAAALRLQKLLFNLGFAARIETLNTVEAFLGSLPGHGVENVRRPLVTTLNFADIAPTSSIWTGSPIAPCPLYPETAPALCQCITDGNTPFYLNLHVRDVGHTILFGGTGSGKSTALAHLALQMRRYEDATIIAFDKGMSLYAVTKACGGQHFAIGNDTGTLQFCPLQFLETNSDRAWALDWIDTMLALNGVQSSPAQRNEIEQALQSMSATGGKHIHEFLKYIQDTAVRETLLQYSIEGVRGDLLDAEEDGLACSRFMTFELEHLHNLGEKWVVPVLLYLFRRIEKLLHGQPAFIILDEAWLMLENPVCVQKLKEWLKVLRKGNCALIFATQRISDVVNSPLRDVILSETATKIYLPDAGAREEHIALFYRQLGLNDHQINIIARAQRRNDYYLVSEQGCRLFSFALGSLNLAFTGISDKTTVAKIQELEAAYGNDWVELWLMERGLSLDDFTEAA